MSYMDNTVYDILNDIGEGIVILDQELEICFWNHYMEYVTEIKQEKVKGCHIYEVLPNLNKDYFKKSVDQILCHGCKMFFSAAMHPALVNEKKEFNLKISSFQKENFTFFLLEFINVTNQFARINQLKEYVHQLYELNKKLKEKEAVIKNLAYYDQLTGLANRTLFYKLAEKFINNASRHETLLALMFLDVDKFKLINDTYGHEAGDKVLMKVADILTKCTRKGDIVARLGGDEFLILLPYIKEANHYQGIASRIIQAEQKSILHCEKEITISLSMGISVYPYHGKTLDKLILRADQAMYTAKNNGGNQYFIFE